ncbi:hypothetical protein HDV04_000249 [Boothiomyces sp. JEL0838]|nr:hypothetical protein HDV04_000249 [Boothiomyces sp. JEL0838]
MKVHSLYTYPVKSCSSVPVNSCELGEFGFKYDRFWVIAEFKDDKWVMITQREISKMVLIVPKVIVEGDSTTLVLNAPGMSELVVPLAYNHDSVDIIVWKDIVTGTSQGAEAAAWFSQYIGKPVQLFAKDKRRIRTLNQKHTPSVELFAHQPQTAFADGFPFLILSTASVEKFAEGLPEHPFQITPKSFRPNIVIEVPEPFDEETFIKVKVGNVPFVMAARSARCIMTNNNPETGIPDPNVFKHAMRTRRIDPGKKYDACMGMNAIALVDTGKIAVGDKIEVMEKGTHNLKGIWHGNSHPIDPDTIKV